MSTGLLLYFDACVFLLGSVIGSFLNVCIYRMPRGQSVVRPPSHCPSCDQPIRWHDNIPLFAWLWLRGKCRNCRAKISPRYVLVELLTAILFLAVWLKFPFAWVAPVYWVLVGGLIVGTFIDFEHYIIPDEITLGGVVVGVVCSAFFPALHGAETAVQSVGRSLLGVLVGSGVLYAIIELGKLAFGRLKLPLEPNTTVVIELGKLRIGEEETTFEEIFSRESDRIEMRAATLRYGEQSLTDVAVKVSEQRIRIGDQEHELAQTGPVQVTTAEVVLPREAMGLGDLKLMAGIGAFLGWKATLFSLMLSSLLGTVVGLGLIVLGLRALRDKIPYGPYIAMAALVWVFGGSDWVAAYFAGLVGD